MKIFKKKLFWIFLVVIVAGVWWFVRGREKPVEYETITVSRKTVTQIVDATGKVEPTAYADLSFETAGLVSDVFVSVGEAVAAGDVLAKVGDASQRSAWAQASAQTRIAEENEKLARRKWNDMKPEERAAKKLASQSARDAERIAAALLAKTVLRSPLDGVVAVVGVHEGETASLAAPSVRVISDGTLRLSVDIPESDIADISVGQEGVATFDAFGRYEEFPVRVSEIEPEARQRQDVVYYTAKMEILRVGSSLRSGMSADTEIRIGEKVNALYLPLRAVHEDDDGVFVEAPLGEGVVRRAVQTGLEDDAGSVEIVSGLGEGDTVVVETGRK